MAAIAVRALAENLPSLLASHPNPAVLFRKVRDFYGLPKEMPLKEMYVHVYARQDGPSTHTRALADGAEGRLTVDIFRCLLPGYIDRR